MKRSLAFVILCLLSTAVSSAAAVAMGLSNMPLVPGVLLVAYTAIADPPIEAALTAALVGLVMDALGGTPLGVSVIACVLALVSSRLVIGWVTSVRGPKAALFTAGLSAVYALIALVLLFAFQRRQAFGLVSLAVLAVSHALASFVAFPLLTRVLVLLRLEQRGTSLHERMAQK